MKIAFIIPPTVELLDLAGPVQVFTEAKFYGFDFDIRFYLLRNDPVSTSGLVFGKIPSYTKCELFEGDFVFIPGMDQKYVRSSSFKKEREFFAWLRQCSERKVNVCSVCNGAFALGHAGLLNGLECTTHWRRVDELQSQFPEAKVLADVLYVKNRFICTSAGISAGVDLGLSILENLAGAHFTHKVARGLVVFYRKNSTRKKASAYLDSRSHINVNVHDVQDYLFDNVGGVTSVEKLASIAKMSPRNLTRVFKETTGTTINGYVTEIRRQIAMDLLKNPSNTMKLVASKCGFKTVRQLQRILKAATI